MRMWGYYARRTFCNSIKKFFRGKVILVILAVMFAMGILGGTIGKTLSVLFPEDAAEELSEQAENGAVEEWEIGTGSLEEDIALVKIWLETGIELVLILCLLSGIYSGSKKGSDIFPMADVNFLFTAPLKPQSVLLFRLSFQMAAALFASVYMLFQIPNLILNLHLSGYAAAVFFLAWILLLLLQRLVSVWIYTLAASHSWLQRYIFPAVLSAALMIVLITAGTYFATGNDIVETVSRLYASDWSRMIPVIGWFKAMVMMAADGKIMLSFLYFLLLVFSMAAMVWGIWRIKADFYEDAAAGAQIRAELAQAAEASSSVSIKRAKERSGKIRRNQGLKGSGANVFLYKELYNRRRFAKLGFVTKTMLVYLLVSVLCLKFFGLATFTASGIVLAGILFFRNYGNPIAAETSLNWLFLMPENPYKKVFYAMMAGTVSCGMDLLPGIVATAVLAKCPPLMALLWFVVLLAMDFMLSATGMLLEALFPARALDVLKSVLQFILKFVVLFFLVAALLVGYLFSGIMAGLVCVLGLSVVFGALGFFLYPAMLHRGIG